MLRDHARSYEKTHSTNYLIGFHETRGTTTIQLKIVNQLIIIICLGPGNAILKGQGNATYGQNSKLYGSYTMQVT